MKRHKELRTLSWEHHDGLVVSFRLKKGLNRHVPAEDLSGYIRHVWDNALEHHFWQEEEMIPLHIQNLENGPDMVHQLMAEHQAFRTLIKKIKDNPGQEKNISEFAELLNRHIHFEEKLLFPFIEQNVTPGKLTEIGGFLAAHHRKADHQWQPKFWQNAE